MYNTNKAHLRDLKSAMGLVTLLKLDSNCQFFSPFDLEIWWMTSINNRTPLLYYIKLCASLQIHWWIQTGVEVRKCWIQVKICNFLPCVTLKFDGWPWKTIGHLFYTTLSFVYHFKAIGEFMDPYKGPEMRKVIQFHDAIMNDALWLWYWDLIIFVTTGSMIIELRRFEYMCWILMNNFSSIPIYAQLCGHMTCPSVNKDYHCLGLNSQVMLTCWDVLCI